MTKKNKIILTIVILIIGIFLSMVSLKGIYLAYRGFMGDDLSDEIDFKKKDKEVKGTKEEDLQASEVDNKIFTEPIVEFEKRITKKPFGIYIDPVNSPVQPERFQGYHTGVDVEYEDVKDEIDVLSIADGKIILSRWVSGYGGVVAISHNIENENIISLYGHLDPESLVSINKEINKGDKIGILGDGETNETDYERKHLHFGIIKGGEVDLRGYVNSENELKGWYDPVEFIKGKN